MNTVSLHISQKFVCKLDTLKEKLSDPDNEPLVLIRIYEGLLQELTLVIQSIQAGGARKVERDENEDAELVLKELRETFTPNDLCRFIDDLHDVISFAEICKEAKFICDNLTRNEE